MLLYVGSFLVVTKLALETINRIKQTEAAAAQTEQNAREEAQTAILHAKERAKETVLQIQQQAEKKAEMRIQQARKDAQALITEAEKKSAQQAQALKEQAQAQRHAVIRHIIEEIVG